MIKHLWFLFAFQSIYEETQSSWLAPFALPISVFSKRIGVKIITKLYYYFTKQLANDILAQENSLQFV